CSLAAPPRPSTWLNISSPQGESLFVLSLFLSVDLSIRIFCSSVEQNRIRFFCISLILSEAVRICVVSINNSIRWPLITANRCIQTSPIKFSSIVIYIECSYTLLVAFFELPIEQTKQSIAFCICILEFCLLLFSFPLLSVFRW